MVMSIIGGILVYGTSKWHTLYSSLFTLSHLGCHSQSLHTRISLLTKARTFKRIHLPGKRQKVGQVTTYACYFLPCFSNGEPIAVSVQMNLL